MMAFQYRRRKKLSLDGTVPGIVYNRHHGGHRPASFPIDNLARGGAPQDYMGFRPDEYEPHPGESAFFEPDYSPYDTDLPPLAPNELHIPIPSAQSELHLVEHHDQPIDHDVRFDGLPGPTINGPLDGHTAINEIWDRVLNRPTYDSLPMTDELLARAMQEIERPPDALDQVLFDDDVMAEDVMASQELFEAPDEIPVEDCAFPEELGMPQEMLPGPDVVDAFGAGPVDYDPGGMVPGSLEQIVEDLTPQEPELEPVMEEQLYEDEMLMDPWVIPGMGPPGLGPMGPGM